jgi:hypothetical protein
LIALSTGNVVVFWLFARALFDEDFRLRWYHGLIWAAVVGANQLTECRSNGLRREPEVELEE